jgi:hypothetical protein
MFTILSGIFLILHGIVFYLYAGQSARLFELKPGMIWPDSSWLFSKSINDKTTRKIGLIFCLLSGTGFIAGGIALFLNVNWWQQIVIISVAFSSIILILLWNGSLQKLADQGLIGVILNLVILSYLLI